MDKKLKIGIICVYYVPLNDLWIAEQQISHIKKNSNDYCYQIYGADVRLEPQVKDFLLSEEVKLINFQGKYESPNREHGCSLDNLVNVAIEDRCDIIVTLDVDSWPISPDWIQSAIKKINNSDGVVAVHRAENNATYLPHPCGTFLTRDFIEKHNFQFFPPSQTVSTPEFQNFLKITGQAIDTGIGLGFTLFTTDSSWQKLSRSNTKELHYLMAGIYDNNIFHVGGGGRNPVFEKDLYPNRVYKFLKKAKNVPLVWRILESRRKKVASRNRLISEKIKSKILNNPDKLYEFLSK